jgi:uncharacterized protein
VAVAAAGAAAAASGRVAGEAPEGSLPDLALKGIEAWMQEPGRVRFLYQGILQVGVGFYHLQNDNWRGATGLLRNGAVRLREFEPVTLGLNVAKLIRESERCLRELESLGRERIDEFDRSGVPKVEWAE